MFIEECKHKLTLIINHLQKPLVFMPDDASVMCVFLKLKQVQWNLYKAVTIRSKKKCPLYGEVRFIECFPKTQLFSKI